MGVRTASADARGTTIRTRATKIAITGTLIRNAARHETVSVTRPASRGPPNAAVGPHHRLGAEDFRDQPSGKQLRDQRIAERGDDAFADPCRARPMRISVIDDALAATSVPARKRERRGDQRGARAIACLQRGGGRAADDRQAEVDAGRPGDHGDAADLAHGGRQRGRDQKGVEREQRDAEAQRHGRRQIALREQFAPARGVGGGQGSFGQHSAFLKPANLISNSLPNYGGSHAGPHHRSLLYALEGAGTADGGASGRSG